MKYPARLFSACCGGMFSYLYLSLEAKATASTTSSASADSGKPVLPTTSPSLASGTPVSEQLASVSVEVERADLRKTLYAVELGSERRKPVPVGESCSSLFWLYF